MQSMGTATARRRKRRSRFSAATADRHILYQLAVQNVEAEIDFVDDTFRELRGRRAKRLREDFCGTAATSCEWVRRRPSNTAVGLDIDRETLDWGEGHNIGALSPAQQKRVALLPRDVRKPGRGAGNMDIVLAMNFSYNCFKMRAEMLAYFSAVRRSLAPGGLLFMDFYGGAESMSEQEEPRECEGFTYVWEHARFNPITGDLRCHIHFHFPDGSKMRRAFSYEWRLWTLPEVREILAEAGFSRSTVYWEGDDGDGGGDGEFTPTEEGDACDSWIAYLVVEP